MELDFEQLKNSFYDVLNSSMAVYFSFILPSAKNLNCDELWESCYQIEHLWNIIIHKNKSSLRWVFFGDYPTDVSSYMYNHPIYGKKLIKKHLDRGIVLFDLIPLTLTYKNIKSDFDLDAYKHIFSNFKPFRQQKWKIVRPFIDHNTKFGLTYRRQDEYKDLLNEECESILGHHVEIQSWNRDYGTSCDILDRMEKMILIFE
jgi:hypothetical protein